MSGQPDKRPCILLTRPAGRNRALAAMLDEAGYAVLERPLLEIAAVPMDAEKKKIVADVDLFDDVIFISTNAVEYGLPLLEQYWPQWPASLHWFAVGRGTAARLQARDIEVAFPERGASEGLLELPPLKTIAGHRILIVRGRGGRELLADTLRARGAEVRYLEVYERRPVDYGPAFVGELREHRVECAIITSGEALERFSVLLGQSGFDTALVVSSDRVRVMAFELGFAKVVTVEDMSDRSIVKAVFDIV